MLAAVGLHVLEGEVILQKDPDKPVLLCDLRLIPDEDLVLLRSEVDLLDVVTEGGLPATPEAPSGQVIHAVPDPDRVIPDLDAGEDHGQIHHGLADRRGRVDAVLHCYELDAAFFQESVKCAEVHHVRAYAVNAVDHNAVDQTGCSILPEPVHRRPVDVAADESVVLVRRDRVDLVECAGDIVPAGFQLHLYRIRCINIV